MPEVTWYQGANQEAAVSTGSTLKLDRVRQSDGGEYKCKAESLLGIAENSITLVVRGAPIITSDSGTGFRLLAHFQLSALILNKSAHFKPIHRTVRQCL